MDSANGKMRQAASGEVYSAAARSFPFLVVQTTGDSCDELCPQLGADWNCVAGSLATECGTVASGGLLPAVIHTYGCGGDLGTGGETVMCHCEP